MKTVNSLREIRKITATKVLTCKPKFGITYVETGKVSYSNTLVECSPQVKPVNKAALEGYINKGYTFSESRKEEIAQPKKLSTWDKLFKHNLQAQELEIECMNLELNFFKFLEKTS